MAAMNSRFGVLGGLISCLCNTASAGEQVLLSEEVVSRIPVAIVSIRIVDVGLQHFDVRDQESFVRENSVASLELSAEKQVNHVVAVLAASTKKEVQLPDGYLFEPLASVSTDKDSKRSTFLVDGCVVKDARKGRYYLLSKGLRRLLEESLLFGIGRLKGFDESCKSMLRR